MGERELFAAVVSSANGCGFCVVTHGEIAARELGWGVLVRLDAGTFGPRATTLVAREDAAAEATSDRLPADSVIACDLPGPGLLRASVGLERRLGQRAAARWAGAVTPPDSG